MTDSSKSDPYGFLSVVKLAGGTVVGGYLLLNALGRPIEFHCTEALKPTRAQEILYGPTLTPFIYSEQLGQSLITAAKTHAQVVFTDASPALDLRKVLDVPVILVRDSSELASDEKPLREVAIGKNRLFFHIECGDRWQTEFEKWQLELCDWNLVEPFTRIHEAIAETHKAA
ncbi:MAG: hypothetical protein KDB27_25255 [Planctomycetales bacterium]|nr:hypothetical protein [Planctomycetales bacterium]